MNAQDLKNSILQLAVQGKLVEQRPEEGTAKGLLAQIKAEKEQLIKDKKIKKEKPLPEITEEEKPFDIPESWEWVRLGEISTYGHTKQKISPKDIEPNMWSLDLEDVEKDSGLVVKRLLASERKITGDKVIFKQGNILYSKLRPYLLKILVADADGICTPELVPFDTYSDIDNKYIMWVLKAPHINYIVNAVSYGVKMPRVGTETMLNLLIPLPPLAEQKRIVSKIEEILPYIEQYDKAYTKLETFNKKFPSDMKKSILQLAMQGKLVEQREEEGTAEELYQQIVAEKARLIKEGKIKKEKPLAEITDDEIPFEIPESWKWVRWGDLSYSIQYGYNAPALEVGKIKMVRISDIQNNDVAWDSVPYCDISDEDIETYLLAPNDILFARTGGTVGKSYLVKEVQEKCVYAGYLIRTRYSNKLVPQYLKLFMESQLYWQQLRNGTIATAQPNCNGKTLAKMIVPLPPLAEQKRIVAKLEQMLPYCEQLTNYDNRCMK